MSLRQIGTDTACAAFTGLIGSAIVIGFTGLDDWIKYPRTDVTVAAIAAGIFLIWRITDEIGFRKGWAQWKTQGIAGVVALVYATAILVTAVALKIMSPYSAGVTALLVAVPLIALFAKSLKDYRSNPHALNAPPIQLQWGVNRRAAALSDWMEDRIGGIICFFLGF